MSRHIDALRSLFFPPTHRHLRDASDTGYARLAVVTVAQDRDKLFKCLHEFIVRACMIFVKRLCFKRYSFNFC